MSRPRRLTGKDGDLVRRYAGSQPAMVRRNMAAAYPDVISTYLFLPGTSGNYARTPDTAQLDVVGDIDLRVGCALVDWTPAADQVLIAKSNSTGNNRSYIFYTVTTGVLRLLWSSLGTGASSITKDSTEALTITDGDFLLVRVTLDVDNGAAGNTVTFYTKATSRAAAHAAMLLHTGWTQLGDPVVTASTTAIFASTSRLNMGSINDGTANLAAGNFACGAVYAGIAGTKVFDVDYTVGPVGATSIVEAANSAVVTIIRGSAPSANIIDGAA